MYFICIHSGFRGHQNDAQTYRSIPDIGPGFELDFPGNLRILGDSIYPNGYPLLTPYKTIQIRKQEDRERRRRRKFNRMLRSRRVYVEHVIKEIKTYKCIGGIYRHQRQLLANVVELCAGLSQRKADFLLQL